jgi:hypothetical protein
MCFVVGQFPIGWFALQHLANLLCDLLSKKLAAAYSNQRVVENDRGFSNASFTFVYICRKSCI